MAKSNILANSFFIVVTGLFSAIFNIAIASLGFFVFARLYDRNFDNTQACKGLAIRRLFLADAVINSVGIVIALFSILVHLAQLYTSRNSYNEGSVDVRGGSLTTSLRGCIGCGSLGILIAISVLFWGNSQSCSNVFPNDVYRVVWAYLISNYVFLATVALCSCLMWSGVGAYTTYSTTYVVTEEKQPLEPTAVYRATKA
jgi:hypothetical protein